MNARAKRLCSQRLAICVLTSSNSLSNEVWTSSPGGANQEILLYPHWKLARRPLLTAEDEDLSLGQLFPTSAYPEDDHFELSPSQQANTVDPQRIQQCTRIIRLLFENGASVDVEGGSEVPLHLACLISSLPMIQLLIDHGSRVSHKGGSLKTTLFAAVKSGNPEVLSMMLENGADVNHLRREFGTALHLACLLQNPTMVRQLLQHGATFSTLNRHGRLHSQSPSAAQITYIPMMLPDQSCRV